MCFFAKNKKKKGNDKMKILVINAGRITGVLDGRTARKDEIGLLMTKSQEEEDERDGEN